MKFLLLLALGALPVNASGNSITENTSDDKSSRVCRALQDKCLLEYIFSLLEKHDTLSTVNRLSREIFTEMYPGERLANITGYAPFVNMEAGDEYNKLLAACKCMKGRLADIFIVDSAFYPQLPLTVDFVVMTVMNDLSRTSGDKVLYFSWLAMRLVSDENVLALARLLEIVPDDFFSKDDNYRVSPRIYYELAAVNQVLALKLLKLNPSHLHYSMLPEIILAEVPLNDLKSLFDPRPIPPSFYHNGTPFSAIIELCTSNFPILSAEKRARILQQNIDLMSWAEGIVRDYAAAKIAHNMKLGFNLTFPQAVTMGSDFDRPLALLLNRMRFSIMSDEELRVEMAPFLNGDDGIYMNVKIRLILCALIHMQNSALFKEIWKRFHSTLELQSCSDAILQHPNFANDFSVDEYRPLMYSHSPLAVVRFEKTKSCNLQTVEEIQKIADTVKRLAVIAELDPDNFKEAVQRNMPRTGHYYTLLSTVELFLREFDKPAWYVDRIWSHIDVQCKKTREWLNKPETLRLFLSREEGIALLYQISQQVRIRPEPDFFLALLEEPDLVKTVLSDKCSMIIRNLVMDPRKIGKSSIMSWHKMLTLFSILHIPICKSFDGTVNKNTLTEFKNGIATVTVQEIADRAMNPEFLPHLACMIAEIDCETFKFQNSVKSWKPNPLLLRFFFLYELWFSTARTHFEAYAPPLVKSALTFRARPSEGEQSRV